MKHWTAPERQEFLAAIIDSSDDAIISKDLTSHITSWNRAAQRLFGYTEEEMIGQLIHKLIPPDRQAEEEAIIESLKKGERVDHFETIRLTKDGREIHVSLSISPIKDQSGKIVGASKIARDITRQKQYEEQLRVINELAKTINAKLDVDTILQAVTDASTKLCGAAFGAFFYNKIDDKGEAYMLYTLSGAPREAFDKFGMPRNTAVFNPTFAGTGTVRSDDITKDPRYGHNAPHRGMPSGHLPVVSYLAIPVVSPGGVVIGGLFFGHPKPARFTAEHESLIAIIAPQAAIALDNAKLYQEINILNGKKDQFIGFASHELKTPLTTLKGYLDIAKLGKITVDDYFVRAERQIGRLERIINDLLDISRIQAGKLEFHFEHVSLFDLIKESRESVNVGQRKVQVELPKDDLQICVDRQKMSQVIVNLLANAVKYSDPGTTIWINVRVFGDEIQLSITDEGIGITPDSLEQIFTQYYRTSLSEKKAEGMGLGLYIAKEIVDAHSGRIWVESEVGKGSVFYIAFPIERRVK
jgi:PAS domain S-box-containing protein